MADASDIKNGEAKVMLGFIVRRCATDLGHVPTPFLDREVGCCLQHG